MCDAELIRPLFPVMAFQGVDTSSSVDHVSRKQTTFYRGTFCSKALCASCELLHTKLNSAIRMSVLAGMWLHILLHRRIYEEKT